MHAFIKVNGNVYPAPDVGLGFALSTAVTGGRNENNVFKGQRVGRDNYKIDGCQWTSMDAATWSNLLMEFEKNFYATVEFPDMLRNQWQTKIMYPGDRSATPMEINPVTGLPSTYKNCKCNLIDTGK